MRYSRMRILSAVIAPFLALPAGAAELTQKEIDDWFSGPSQSTANVNEGDLVFLAQKPAKAVHHHHNTLTLSRESLTRGWAQLEQCHKNIDKVPRAQILFNLRTIKDLRITSYSNIEHAWVEGPSVQLKNVGSDAKLCVAAQSRALTKTGENSYTLKNGPFMRRFLDGYYPMHVSMTVKLAGNDLVLASVYPKEQPGFIVRRMRDRVDIEAWFEGRLNTELRFNGR